MEVDPKNKTNCCKTISSRYNGYVRQDDVELSKYNASMDALRLIHKAGAHELADLEDKIKSRPNNRLELS